MKTPKAKTRRNSSPFAPQTRERAIFLGTYPDPPGATWDPFLECYRDQNGRLMSEAEVTAADRKVEVER